MKQVFFLRSGLTAVTDENGKHVPELQESWFMLYIYMLLASGEKPEECQFTMPDGTRARVFKTEAGYRSYLVCEQQQRTSETSGKLAKC